MLKADLHMHSEYSMDCNMPLEKIIERCQEVGVNCIALSDHGTAEGALKLREIAPFKVIVAEEVLTPHGEIMGLFLEETIPSGLSAEATIDRIKAQNGLVCNLKVRGKRNNFIIKSKYSIPYIPNSLKLQLFNFFFKIYYRNQLRFDNLFYSSLWVLLERQN